MSLLRYPEYKDSGIRWLGRIPMHWRVDRLKASIADCKNGVWGNDPNGDSDDIDCVRVADFDRVRLLVDGAIPTIRSVNAREREGRLLRRGDLLLEKSGGGEKQPVGQVALYDRDAPAVCSNFIAKISLAPGMVPRFWTYQHAAAYAAGVGIAAIKQTSGIQNLDQSQYFDERGVYPDEDEQHAIATFLDRETAKIDALIAEQEKLLALLAEKRQATISHAVTRGLNPNVPKKDSGIPWLGEVPMDWSVISLKRLVAVGSSISYGIVQPGEPLEDGVPFVQTTNMTSGDFSLEKLQRTSIEIADQYPRSQLVGGEVLLGIRASIGAAHVAPPHLSGCNLSRGIARIEPDDRIKSNYLVAYLASSAVSNYWQMSKQGSTFNEVSIETVRELFVPVPSKEEQLEIINFVESEKSKIDKLRNEAERAIALLKERRNALVSATVTGKIDVRQVEEC